MKPFRTAGAINTEKARSELLFAPILLEVRRHLQYQISLFSGVDFNVAPEKGLAGFCDFILSRSTERYFIVSPVVTIVEAKNENIKSGLRQCVAEMMVAQIANLSSANLDGADLQVADTKGATMPDTTGY